MRIVQQSGKIPPEKKKCSLHEATEDTAHIYSMLTTRRWACLQRFTTVNPYRTWSVQRSQSTVSSPASAISPALLERAQALAAEHAELSKQLHNDYDMRIAKKAGSLSSVATALNSWESASNVCLQAARQTLGH